MLTEAKKGGYRMLIVGWCGASPATHALVGSIADKIVYRGRDGHLHGGITDSSLRLSDATFFP